MSTRIGKKYISKYGYGGNDGVKIIFEVKYDNSHQVLLTWLYHNDPTERASLISNYDLNTFYKEYHEPVTDCWYIHVEEGMPFLTKVHDINTNVCPLIGMMDIVRNPETNEVISSKIINCKEPK